MNRTLVNSADIRSIGYDLQSAILEVEFISGGIYQYVNVLEHLHRGLMSAASKGQFLDSYIKYNCQYKKIR